MEQTRAGRTLASIAGAAILACVLGSCALLEGPTPTTPDRTRPEQPAEPAEFVPGGSAEENLPFFTRVLDEYAATEQPVEGQPIVDAVSGGGFDRDAMQVSFDRSKTNLVADSIYVSVRIGEECLIGQMVTENREVVTERARTVGPNADICLIGETRAIDW